VLIFFNLVMALLNFFFFLVTYNWVNLAAAVFSLSVAIILALMETH
jgi:hypothetical protein